ncbi:MAG TPA: chromosome segregation protein SMC, partial [Limnochordia bacterium]|nr:chromosome segregation protein SMC [Limnochordia bacterium]
MNGLRLNSLKLHGFKSFASAVELAFPDGISAIVGPNGSGKSNVADAVRWVLGEQSLKALRGANLQDVIFAGSDQKRALGMAEVSIHFDNSGRELPLDYDEVRITRRAFRSGDSEFEINDARCRLRDIQELFLDTGLGKGAFSLVGQGEIDAVLSAQPTERRLILEEAAGIARYRQRRAETEKELLETEANLTRIEDVAAEVRQQLEPLAAERDRARAYRELAARRDALDCDLGLHEWRRLQAQSTQLSEQAAAAAAQAERRTGERDAAEAAEAAATARLKAVQAELEAALDGLRSTERDEAEARHRQERLDGEREQAARALEEASARKEQATAAAAAARARLGDLAAGLAGAATAAEAAKAQAAECGEAVRSAERERAAAERAVESAEGSLRRAEAEAASLAAARAATEQALAGARGRRSGAEGDAKSLDERLAAAQARLEGAVAEREAARAALRDVEASLRAADAEREAAERRRDESQAALAASARAADERAARAQALARLEEAGEGYFHGVRAVLAKQGELGGLLGPVARLIAVPKRLERALDTALGGAQQHVVARDEAAVARAIDYLKRTRTGRATFLPVDTVRKAALRPEERRVLQEAEGVVGPACELIEIDPEARPAVEHLLGRVVVMEDLAAALAVAKRLGGGIRLTTLDGELINPGGAITGGSANRPTGALLARQRELSALRVQLEEDRARARELEAAVAEAAAALDGARGELELRREARAAAQQRCARGESECEQLTARVTELEADRARLQEREAHTEREIAAEAERLHELTTRVAAAEAARAEAQAVLTAARQAREGAAQAAQAAQAAWADARLAEAEAARTRDGLTRERQDCETTIAREEAAARAAA